MGVEMRTSCSLSSHEHQVTFKYITICNYLHSTKCRYETTGYVQVIQTIPLYCNHSSFTISEYVINT